MAIVTRPARTRDPRLGRVNAPTRAQRLAGPAVGALVSQFGNLNASRARQGGVIGDMIAKIRALSQGQTGPQAPTKRLPPGVNPTKYDQRMKQRQRWGEGTPRRI